MQITLASPPADGYFKNVGYMPPMQLAYVAGSVRNLPEVTVSLVDGAGEGLYAEEAADRILRTDPDVVGISVTSADIQRSLKILKMIKKGKPGVVTIFGGHHATRFDDLLLQHISELDMAMRGETEESFPKLCLALLRGESIAEVPGLSFRSNGRVIRGVPQVIEDVDSIPFPDRTIFDNRNYWQGLIGIKVGNKSSQIMTSVISSRGCPHRCTFCSKLTPAHNDYRHRSAENLLQEILELRDAGYKLIVFLDENFSKDLTRVKRLCHLILDQRLELRFAFQGTLHNLSQSVLDLMHQAGFDLAAVGVESGSNDQLKRYGKAAESQGIAKGILRAKKAHMIVHGSFIHGHPRETPQDYAATRRFVRQVRPHTCTMYELCAYPGTALWKELLGNSAVTTVADTGCRSVHEISGLVDKEYVDKQIRRFWRAFGGSWLHWTRFFEITGLFFHNPTFRNGLTRAFREMTVFLVKLLRGEQMSR